MNIHAPYSSKRHPVFPGKMTYFPFGHPLNTPGCLSGSRKAESKKSPATSRGERWHLPARGQDGRARIPKHLPVVNRMLIAPDPALPKSSSAVLPGTRLQVSGLPDDNHETSR